MLFRLPSPLRRLSLIFFFIAATGFFITIRFQIRHCRHIFRYAAFSAYFHFRHFLSFRLRRYFTSHHSY